MTMLSHAQGLFLPFIRVLSIVHIVSTEKAMWKKVLKMPGLWKKSWHFETFFSMTYFSVKIPGNSKAGLSFLRKFCFGI